MALPCCPNDVLADAVPRERSNADTVPSKPPQNPALPSFGLKQHAKHAPLKLYVALQKFCNGSYSRAVESQEVTSNSEDMDGENAKHETESPG